MNRIFLIFLLLQVSCSPGNSKNKPALSAEKMQLVLWDVIEADVFTYTIKRTDSSVNPSRENALMQESIFKKHKVSREEFYTSMDYYVEHSDQFVPMLDSMMARHPAVSPSRERKPRMMRDSLKLIAQ